MNDFTFEPLPDFSCFWFASRGPERCFLLGDLLPLIMVQDESFILTFPCEKEGLEFQDILENTGFSSLSGIFFSFFFNPQSSLKAKAVLKACKEKFVRIGNQFGFLTGDQENESSVWFVH